MLAFQGKWDDFFHCTPRRQVVAAVLLGGLLFAPAFDLLFDSLTGAIADRINQDPITVHRVWADNPVKSGGILYISVQRTKHRDCPSRWDSFLVGDGQPQYHLASHPGSAVGVGTDTLRFGYRIPPTIPPGRYEYSAIGVYSCPSGQMIYRQPDALVIVE